MRNFKELEIWQESHMLAMELYAITKAFPKEELYGLVSQMRRSSQSIPSNIAEGCGRNSSKELIRFCHISMGSASELEYQIILAKDLELLDPSDSENLTHKLVTLKKRLNSFLSFLKRDQTQQTNKTNSPKPNTPITQPPNNPKT